MNENIKERNEEIEIDLQRLANAVMNKSWLVGIVAVVCAVVAFLGTFFFITPMYESSVMFYVNNSSLSLGEAAMSITTGDISASRGLVKNYIIILNTRETLNDVIDYADSDLTYNELKRMISAEAVESTEIFEVVVTNSDPKEAEELASAIAYILPKRISTIVEGTSAKVVDSAVLPSRPSSPNYTKNTLIGFVFGLMLTVAVIVMRDLVDITVRTEEDLQRVCKHPVLAAVPDMLAPSKGGYYYGYGKDKKQNADHGKHPDVVGADISFAASEAYKLLRTKLQFSFADEKACRVIGISSALTGEGKSLSSINLAYSLSQLNQRVLLIDCDMRRPSLAAKLPIQKAPGLSDFLAGQSRSDNLIQNCGLKDDERAFHVVSAGRNPPNPMELLSSKRMEQMLALLRQNYDYIILDLPPVGEVGDALAVAKLTDGMLLVVRQNYGNRLALGAAVRQFAFVDSRILGIVYNCTDEGGNGYSKKYYKKYGKKYENSYYRAAAKAAKKQNQQ